jgi:hypothetical protein
MTEERLREIRTTIERLRASLPAEVIRPALEYNAVFQLLCARAAFFWRTEELARNACDALERSDFAAAAILTRGVMETAALVWKLMDLLDSRTEYSAQEMSAHLMRALVGWKAERGQLPEAYNAITLVKRMDRILSGVWNNYESLSEFAHPNWRGALGIYGKEDRERQVVSFGRAIRNPERHARVIANGLQGSLGAFEYAYNKISDTIPLFVAELAKV